MDIVLNIESTTGFTGGIGQYTRNLLTGLRQRDDIGKIHCFARLQWIDTERRQDTESAEKPTQGKATARVKEILRSVPFALTVNAAIKNHRFQQLARKLAGSVYHEPNFILMPFDGPSVTTFHDLSFIHHPQYHPRERIHYMEKNLATTLQRADHIITDSVYVSHELIDLLGVDAEKVTAIPLGVSSRFKPRHPTDMLSVLTRYNLQPGMYLLSVATLEPRKNIDHLLDAYLTLEKKLRTRFPLVIVGAEGWRSSKLKERIRDLQQKGEVIRPGFIPAEDLPVFFSGTAGFVYVPYYEGFGLPPLEAMASGTPILTSNVSSIPEVVGDAGLLADPDDIDAMAQGMKRMLLDEDWIARARANGLQRAALFDWSRTVDLTVDVYKKVLGQ